MKGHSGDEGNDAADKRANWGQNGGASQEQEIGQMMAFLRDHGRHPDPDDGLDMT